LTFAGPQRMLAAKNPPFLLQRPRRQSPHIRAFEAGRVLIALEARPGLLPSNGQAGTHEQQISL
ncbi:hypothetical protein, partial [Pseudomonas sp. DP16D-R1]|uniref:hypothetical protein n=1 Tax=Pseudomonas sp. DP16D-R1 TaxID=2075551 RepID=UPI001A91C343